MGESAAQREVTEAPIVYRTVACGTWPDIKVEGAEGEADYSNRRYRLSAVVCRSVLSLYVTNRAFQPFDRTDVDDFAEVTAMAAQHYGVEVEGLRRLIEVTDRHRDFEG